MAERLHHEGAFSKPPLYVSAKNETIRMFDNDSMDSLPARRRLHALRCAMEARVLALCCRGIVPSRYASLDPARVLDPPIHFPLRTEDSHWKTAALYHSRRASRLSKRCKEACYAAQC